MQTSLKSFVSRALRQSVSVAEASRTIGAPQPLPVHLHQFVGGGSAKGGWNATACPKGGWSAIGCPKGGW